MTLFHASSPDLSALASIILGTLPVNAVPRLLFPAPANLKVSEMTTSALTIASQFATLLGEDLFLNFAPVIGTAVSNVNANPQLVLNPLNAGIFGVQLLANLQAAIPGTESVAVQDVAQIAQAALTALNAKMAALAVTPATVAASIVGQTATVSTALPTP